MSKSIVFIMFVVLVCLLTVSLVNADEKERIYGKPYYYGDFAGYKIPFQPVEELTYEIAIKRDTYYVAYYDYQGKIVLFEKYLYGRLEFSDKYFYRPSGILERREGTKSTGEIVIYYFDDRGKIIKENKN